ncbi:hypothetical protein ACFX2A_000343 [Malus domestica]
MLCSCWPWAHKCWVALIDAVVWALATIVASWAYWMWVASHLAGCLVARAWVCCCMVAYSPWVVDSPKAATVVVIVVAAIVVPRVGGAAPLGVVLSLVDHCGGTMPRSHSFGPNP